MHWIQWNNESNVKLIIMIIKGPRITIRNEERKYWARYRDIQYLN